jgi:hypothetical protein
MRAATQFFIASLAIDLAATICAGAGGPARPWPGRQVYTSANGRFQAVVEPGGDRGPVVVSVFDGAPDGTSMPKWTAALTCAVAPLKVLVSDDGHDVVTFDNWLRPGYGEDAVALYIAGTPVARWPVERILLPGEIKSLRASPEARPWRVHAIEQLVEFDGRTFLSIWLGDLGRFAILDLATARWRVTPAAPLLAACEDAARAWSLAQFERAGGDRLTGVLFLGALRDVRDCGLLERQLSATGDYQSSEHYFGDKLLRVLGRSEIRRAADAALAAWGGLEPAQREPGPAAWQLVRTAPGFREAKAEQRRGVPRQVLRAGGDSKTAAIALQQHDQAMAALERRLARDLEQAPEERYALLGVVDVTVRLPAPPGEPPGELARGLYVYLVPENVGPADWAKARPVHHVAARFSESPDPSEQWPATVPVGFGGVTPGRYWVKAVYECAPLLVTRGDGAVVPGAGDTESTERKVVEVTGGELYRDNFVDVPARAPSVGPAPAKR